MGRRARRLGASPAAPDPAEGAQPSEPLVSSEHVERLARRELPALPNGRAYLLALSAALPPARALRYEPDELFDDLSLDDLDLVARNLNALAYSCREGARKLERIHAGRRGEGNPVDVATAEPGE